MLKRVDDPARPAGVPAYAGVAQLYAILSQLFSHVLHFSQEDYILLVGLVGIAASISNRDSFIPERKIGGRE